MKTKWIGLAILAVVIVAAAGYAVFSANAQVLELNGYLGGEKIGLFEDAGGPGDLPQPVSPLPGLRPRRVAGDDHRRPNGHELSLPLQPDRPRAL